MGMEIDTAMLVKSEGLASTSDIARYKHQICAILGVDFDELMRELGQHRQTCRKLDQFQTDCERLSRRCDTQEAMLRLMCCPGNQLYSQVTLDEYSNNNQVEMETIVTGLGDPYVDSWPLPPQKSIRLRSSDRPGYTPEKIAIDLGLANNADNYLDLRIQFYLAPGGHGPKGKPYGPRYRGNQFLNKNGTQIHVPFPPYEGKPITVGAKEHMAVEIFHGGPNNLNSAYITLYHDAASFYERCKASCDPTSCG